MTARPSGEVWAFDDFQPGRALGSVTVTLDETRTRNWNHIYGASQSDGAVPKGMLVAAMMEAYLEAFQPRPPGNIHAGQKLEFASCGVRPGTSLEASVTCLDKRLRKERRWVTFAVTLRDGSQEVLRGEIRTIWAK